MQGVDFVPFIGISPYRYRDLFERGKRKYGGLVQNWNRGVRRPAVEIWTIRHIFQQRSTL